MYFLFHPTAIKQYALVMTLGSGLIFICMYICPAVLLSVYIEIRLSVLLLNFSFCLSGVSGYTRSPVFLLYDCLHVVCLSGYDSLSLCCTHWASLNMSVCLSVLVNFLCWSLTSDYPSVGLTFIDKLIILNSCAAYLSPPN
jgi:hypothetical protein